MKLYAQTISQTLPKWATVVTKSADLFEVEINDEHPNFQSLLEELTTEIEPGIIGVKAKDLCSRLGFEQEAREQGAGSKGDSSDGDSTPPCSRTT